MLEKMLKFTDLDKQTPKKRNIDNRKEDFKEIYDEFLDEKAKDHNILNETIQKNNIFNIMSNSFGFGGTNATLIFSKI